MWALRDGRDGDGLARRPAGEDDRGDRSEAAGRVHRGREAHDRDARGRARDRSRTSSARTASSRCCRSSSAATRSVCSRTPTARSASRAPVPSCSGSMKIAFGGMTRRGAVLRRVGHRPVGRPRARDAHRGADGRLVRHGRLARVVRGDRGRSDRAGHRRQGARQRGRTRRGREAARPGEGRRAELLDDNRHLVIALRDELLEREELVGDEIVDVLARGRSSARRLDDGRPAEPRET